MCKSTPTVARFWKSGISTLFGVLAASAVMMPAPASAEGLFDFLFGGRPQYDRSVVAYAPDPGFNMLRGPDRPRQKRVKLSPAIEHAVGEKPTKTAPPVAGKGPLGPFVNDPTLRAGDVVVTEQGLMVYRGGSGSHHSAKEFVGIAKAGGVAGNNAALASIEKANRVAATASSQPEVVASTDLVKQANAESPRRRRQ